MRPRIRKPALSFSISLALIVLFVITGCGNKGDGANEDLSSTPSPAESSDASSLSLGSSSHQYSAPHQKPGPAAERILFRSFHVDRAPQDFLKGSMDLYLFSLKTEAARDLRSKEQVRLEEAPATTISLVLNPAPDPSGDFNPLTIQPIRQAIQHLINRDFIANEIYRGMALPMLTHLSPTDFDFLTVFDLVWESDYRYDPEFARKLIEKEMGKVGAIKNQQGKWELNGKPVRLKFIIRTEDERRVVGDLISFELEAAGFEVQRSLQQFAPAVRTVYSTDPQMLEWHLYTEGWARGGSQRYDFAGINQFLAPWQGNMPGWRESGFWQYQNNQLDTLGQKIFTGSFASEAERNEMYRKMTKIGLEESVRIWIATVQNSFPLRADIQGITTDVVAGPKTARSIREAFVPGQDQLTLGNLWVWTARSSWNPIGGFGDVYSNDIWRHLYDAPVATHPFTGIPVPLRADFQVETAGPSGKLTIPNDAVQWNTDKNSWVQTSAQQATSKVTFDFSKYFTSKWHHGQQISMADVLYSIAQGYEIAFDEGKVFVETALGVTARPYLNTFKGYRILDANKLEVYLDFWHFETAQIGSYATPTTLTTPWELLAAMDHLVFDQRRAAYTDTASGRFSVPWISLAIEDDARLVRNTLRDFLQDQSHPSSYFTVGNIALVSPTEAQSRYEAALNWFEEKQMLVISNGPFFLDRYDPAAQFAEIAAFRDSSYPFKPGDFYLGPAPSVEITNIKTSPIERGKPYEISLDLGGPGNLGVRYVLFDPAKGIVIESGNVERSSSSSLLINIPPETTSRLESSFYQVFLAAFSDQVASLTERRIDIETKE